MKMYFKICIIAIGMIAGAQTKAQTVDFQGNRWNYSELTPEQWKAEMLDSNLYNADKGNRASYSTAIRFGHASTNQALKDMRLNGISLHPYKDSTVVMDTITMEAYLYMVSKSELMIMGDGKYTNTCVKNGKVIIEDKTTPIHKSENLKFVNMWFGFDRVAIGMAKMTAEMGKDNICCNVPWATYFVFPRENKPVVVTPTPTPTPAPVVITPTPVVVAPAPVQPTIVYVPQIEYVPQYIPVVQPQPQVCCGGYNEGYTGNGGWGVNTGFNAGFSASVGFSTGYSYPEYYGGGCNNCGGSNGGGGISNVFNNTDSHDYYVNDNSYYNYQNNVGNTTSWSQANTTTTTTNNNQHYSWGTTPAATKDVPWHGGPGSSPDPYDPIDPVDGWGGGTGGAPDGRIAANTKNGVAVKDSWSQQKNQPSGNSGWGKQNQKNTESTQRAQAQSGNQYGAKSATQSTDNSGWRSNGNVNKQSQQRAQAPSSGSWGQQRQASRPTGNGNRAGGQNARKTKSCW